MTPAPWGLLRPAALICTVALHAAHRGFQALSFLYHWWESNPLLPLDVGLCYRYTTSSYPTSSTLAHRRLGYDATDSLRRHVRAGLIAGTPARELEKDPSCTPRESTMCLPLGIEPSPPDPRPACGTTYTRNTQSLFLCVKVFPTFSSSGAPLVESISLEVCLYLMRSNDIRCGPIMSSSHRFYGSEL